MPLEERDYLLIVALIEAHMPIEMQNLLHVTKSFIRNARIEISLGFGTCDIFSLLF